MRNRLLAIILGLGLSLPLAATVHNVGVTSNVFTPNNLVITAGDTVVWTNTMGFHNVNGTTTTYPNNPASFGNSTGTGWTYQFQFTIAGTYDYRCDPHFGLGMIGQVVVNAAPMPAVPCTTPFISEYIEGSGNNKGFEIYNPTGAMLDLGPYVVYLSGNGGSFTNSFNLMGMLAPYDVYAISTDQADPVMLAAADTALAFPSVAHFNGDDALFIVDTTTNDTLDIIGIVGIDPGTNWPVDSGSTANHTLVRMASVDQGQTDWTIGATEWMVYPQNTYTFYGSHTSTCAPAVAVPCTTPFISEYIEGSGNNKGFEIYNPTGTMLDLGPYVVYLSGNGGSFTNSFNLTGMLAPYDVYAVSTDQADPIMLAAADTALAFPSVAHFNGDDALFIVDTTTNDTLDIIGIVGVDPGTNWPVGTGSTANHTLVRMASVDQGQTDWAIGATEWIVNPQNTYTFYGSHTSTCAPVPMVPTVEFAITSIMLQEGSGTTTVNLSITPAATASETIVLQFLNGVNLTPADGFATPAIDTITGLMSLPVNMGMSNVSFDLTVIDDAVIESNETLFVSVASVTAGLSIGMDSAMTIIIEESDVPIPVNNIGDVTSTDANGVPDSLGLRTILYGTVYTDDFDDNGGYSFYAYDNTGGINVFNFDDVSNYTPTRGDSIMMIGEIDQFRGLTEIIVDSIALMGSGIALKMPRLVSVLDESTEGEFIQMDNFVFADTSQWTTGSGGGGFNVDITNGTDTFVMRIDAATDLYNMAIPTTDTFTVIGAGSQFTFSSPALDGYQIFPRDSADIIPNEPFGAYELGVFNFGLYPNPSNDVVSIIADTDESRLIEIYSLTGALVYRNMSQGRVTRVNVSELPTGVYLVSQIQDGARVTHRLIVE